MIRRRIPQRGDVFWISPNPTSGKEMKDRRRFVVITPSEINALGISMMVPIAGGGAFARESGLTVPILGRDTHGVAVCHQVRTFDLEAREKEGSARFIETLDPSTMAEIVNRVISVIDPAEE